MLLISTSEEAIESLEKLWVSLFYILLHTRSVKKQI